jgi:glycosyltransferase involved in cell wall biosynthesis
VASGVARVSIVVPVYNVQSYVDDCLLSLRGQTHPYFTIIAVDDGSTDSSIERIRAHARLDNRIKIVEQENLGLGGARNTGLAHADDEFILFIDGDDFVSSTLLEVLLAAQRESGCDIVSCRLITITEQASFLSYEPRSGAPHLSPYENTLGLLSPSVATARLFERQALIKSGVRFLERLPHEDLFFTYKLLRRCSHNMTEDHLYFHRQRDGSLGHSFSRAYLPVPWRLRDDTRDFLGSVGASEREYALAARRNLMILWRFWKRAGENALFLDELTRTSKGRALEIQEDFEILNRVKIGCPHPMLLPLAQILREAGAVDLESILC